MLTFNLGLGETGPRRNGRMEQNFPVIPIFRNIGTTSRGAPKIRKWDSEKCPFHSLFIRDFLNFWLNGKRPRSIPNSVVWVSKVSRGRKASALEEKASSLFRIKSWLMYAAVWRLSFCGFISLLIGRETINIPEIFSGVHGFTGMTVILVHAACRLLVQSQLTVLEHSGHIWE